VKRSFLNQRAPGFPVLAILRISWVELTPISSADRMVEGGGFEPPKSMTTDLQSVPFGRSGIPPDEELLFSTGADDGTRTRNLLITSQLLYQLSYASLIIIRSVSR
jgi:hypothetical protein